MIKGLIFDVGDIIYSTRYFKKAVYNSLRDLGIKTTYKKISNSWNKIKPKHQAGKQTRIQSWIDVALESGLKKNQTKAYLKLIKKYYAKFRTLKTYPGVKSTLKKLKKKGYKLAILSDTHYPSENRRKEYAKIGVSQHFDIILTSGDLKKVKPHPKTFNTTIKRMKLKKDQVVFVAHAKDELDGAMEQGIITIGYNLDDDATADYVATHFSEIYDIVEKMK